MNTIFLLALTASLVSCEQNAVDDVVTVTYALDEPAVVTVDFQTNVAGSVWASIGERNFTTLAGDVNRYVAAETNRVIRWSAADDWPDHQLDSANFRAVLTAWPTNDPPPYMAVDLGAKQAATREHTAVRYYVSSNAVPGGVLDVRYRRTRLLMKKIDCAGRVFRRGKVCSEPDYNNSRNNPTVAMLTKNFYISVFPFTCGYDRTARNSVTSVTDSNAPTSDATLLPAMGNGCKYSNLRGDPASGFNWPTDGDKVGGVMADLRALTDGKVLFDLPLEAQYEFACQGGFETSLGTGKRYNNYRRNPEVIYETAWTKDNKDDGIDPEFPYPKIADNGGRRPHTAGLLAPNGYGLYDMQGNGRSRCRDWWVEDLSTVTDDLDANGVHVDPKGPSSNANGYHGGRGCGWDTAVSSYDWTTYGRFPQGNDGDYNYTGYRVVCPAIAPDL